MERDKRRPEVMLTKLIKSDFSEVALDTIDTILDPIMDNEEITDLIPAAKQIISLLKILSKQRNASLIKKYVLFLSQLDNTPLEERVQFLDDLEKEGKLEKFQEQVILWIERQDDMGKPEILARLTKAFIMKVIDELTYKKLATALDRVKMYNMAPLVDFYTAWEKMALSEYQIEQYQINLDDLHDLANCGLVGVQLRKEEEPPSFFGYSNKNDESFERMRRKDYDRKMEKYYEDRRNDPFSGYVPNNLGKTFIKVALEINSL
jgi:hypothetical protein